jgi:hypothetical protein
MANLPRPEVRLFGAAEENSNSDDDDEDDVEDEQLHFAFGGGETAKEKEKEIFKEVVSAPVVVASSSSLSAANSNDAQQRRRRSIELGPGGVPAVFASAGPTAKRAKETTRTQSSKRLIGRAEFQSAPMRFPPYARPVEVGTFGLDGQRRMFMGRALLRRFRMPELNVDLEQGFERFVERDPNRPEYLDNLLEFLRFASANESPEARGLRVTKKEKEGSAGKTGEATASAASASQASACPPMRWEKPFDCDVVCWRGLLTKVGGRGGWAVSYSYIVSRARLSFALLSLSITRSPRSLFRSPSLRLFLSIDYCFSLSAALDFILCPCCSCQSHVLSPSLSCCSAKVHLWLPCCDRGRDGYGRRAPFSRYRRCCQASS